MSCRNAQLAGKDRRVWEQGVVDDPRLEEASDVACMYVILRCCQGKPDCWPSNEYLSTHCRMSVRGIQNVVRRLIKAGVLEEVKDKSLKTNRRLLVLSHPSLGHAMECETRGNKSDSDMKPVHAKVGIRNNSSDSSFHSESSSLKTVADDERFESEIPQEIVDQVKAILDPKDIAEVIRDRRLIARKAKGRWELIISVCRYIKRRRDSIRGVIPFMASLLESWQAGIPHHIREMITPQMPPPPRVPTQEDLDRHAKWQVIYARQSEIRRERSLAKAKLAR